MTRTRYTWSIPWLVGLLVVAAACGPPPAPVRVMWEVPDFTLTDQHGQPFGRDRLGGKVWVCNFIFTRCPGTCPVQTRYVKRLQEQLRAGPAWDEVLLVSFTVDPDYDTPEVLREYAEVVGADPQRWFFLTGTRDEIWQLSRDGFKLAVGEAPPEGPGPILHAAKLMLVDRLGRLRGFYEGMNEQGLQELRQALDRVLAES